MALFFLVKNIGTKIVRNQRVIWGLSQIQKGIIVRDERFGYIELATNEKLDQKDFIDCQFCDGECKVTFSVYSQYDLRNGIREKHEFE